jgi:gamma-glutamyltranspeptidase/glutathione hydrolase
MSLRFGKLPFADLFEPAIRYAADGFAVTPVVSRVWRGLRAMYMKFPDLMNSHFQDGRGPESAQFLKFPALAATLDEIAKSGGESFYRGKLARQMAEYARQTGGYLRFEDLAEHRAEWVEPISAGYHGSTIHEMPPNSQGVAALIALAILERFDLAEEPDSAEAIHFQIEAMKLAFAETYAHVGDPSSMGVSTAELLSPSNIARLAKLIDRRHAKFPDAQQSSHGGGTSYLCCGDRDGLVVSYIQSSGPGFGSGILEPRTGIVFQSRGMAFNTNSSHPNVYAPGKRVFHTNAPAIMTRGSQFFAAFGLMGWSMQPQAHVQFVVRAVDHLQAPTTLVDAPRWRIALEEPAILIEPGLEIAAKMLLEKGHRIVPTEKFLAAATPFGSHLMFGGAAYMQSLHHGYAGAADPRRDGAAVGY